MERASAVVITRSRTAACGPRAGRARVGSVLSVVLLLGLVSCGGGSGHFIPPQVVTQIISDSRFDGDIEQLSANSFIVTQGMTPSIQSVFAGHDPTTGNEFRTFLTFPLTGSNGVPGNAIIDSAFLEILVNNLIPGNGSIPVRVELVAFQPPTLVPSDFDRTALPPLGAVLISGNVTSADIGHFVAVDVTSLMVQAQRLGLIDFQVRIMQDLGPAIFTLMEIDNTIASDRAQRAPLLTVTYH